MKYPFALTLAGALIAWPAIADSSPASDESVRQLLELTEAHKLIDAAKVQEKIQQIQQETVQELKQAPGSS